MSWDPGRHPRNPLSGEFATGSKVNTRGGNGGVKAPARTLPKTYSKTYAKVYGSPGQNTRYSIRTLH